MEGVCTRDPGAAGLSAQPRSGGIHYVSAARRTREPNLFAMRRGAFIVGPGSQPLKRDMAQLPRIVSRLSPCICRAAPVRVRWEQSGPKVSFRARMRFDNASPNPVS
jgi:hypothetical protein